MLFDILIFRAPFQYFVRQFRFMERQQRRWQHLARDFALRRLAVHRALKLPRGTAHSLSFIGRGPH